MEYETNSCKRVGLIVSPKCQIECVTQLQIQSFPIDGHVPSATVPKLCAKVLRCCN